MTRALYATPVAAGILWFAVYLYADTLKNWTSDGWGLAPLGTGFIVLAGLAFAWQVLVLLRTLPDTVVGRWAEAVLVVAYGLTVSVTVFGYLGLFWVGNTPDDFPSDTLCVLGLFVGALVTMAVPVATVARRARVEPPAGTPLEGAERVALAMAATATALLVLLPTLANATAHPELLLGLFLVAGLDVATLWLRRRQVLGD